MASHSLKWYALLSLGLQGTLAQSEVDATSLPSGPSNDASLEPVSHEADLTKRDVEYITLTHEYTSTRTAYGTATMKNYGTVTATDTSSTQTTLTFRDLATNGGASSVMTSDTNAMPTSSFHTLGASETHTTAPSSVSPSFSQTQTAWPTPGDDDGTEYLTITHEYTSKITHWATETLTAYGTETLTAYSTETHYGTLSPSRIAVAHLSSQPSSSSGTKAKQSSVSSGRARGSSSGSIPSRAGVIPTKATVSEIPSSHTQEPSSGFTSLPISSRVHASHIGSDHAQSHSRSSAATGDNEVTSHSMTRTSKNPATGTSRLHRNSRTDVAEKSASASKSGSDRTSQSKESKRAMSQAHLVASTTSLPHLSPKYTNSAPEQNRMSGSSGIVISSSRATGEALSTVRNTVPKSIPLSGNVQASLNSVLQPTTSLTMSVNREGGVPKYRTRSTTTESGNTNGPPQLYPNATISTSQGGSSSVGSSKLSSTPHTGFGNDYRSLGASDVITVTPKSPPGFIGTDASGVGSTQTSAKPIGMPRSSSRFSEAATHTEGARYISTTDTVLASNRPGASAASQSDHSTAVVNTIPSRESDSTTARTSGGHGSIGPVGTQSGINNVASTKTTSADAEGTRILTESPFVSFKASRNHPASSVSASRQSGRGINIASLESSAVSKAQYAHQSAFTSAPPIEKTGSKAVSGYSIANATSRKAHSSGTWSGVEVRTGTDTTATAQNSLIHSRTQSLADEGGTSKVSQSTSAKLSKPSEAKPSATGVRTESPPEPSVSASGIVPTTDATGPPKPTATSQAGATGHSTQSPAAWRPAGSGAPPMSNNSLWLKPSYFLVALATFLSMNA